MGVLLVAYVPKGLTRRASECRSLLLLLAALCPLEATTERGWALPAAPRIYVGRQEQTSSAFGITFAFVRTFNTFLKISNSIVNMLKIKNFELF